MLWLPIGHRTPTESRTMDEIIVRDEQTTIDKGEVLDMIGKGTDRASGGTLVDVAAPLTELLGDHTAVDQRVTSA